MPEITQLGQLNTAPATYEQVQALRARVKVQLHNIMLGNGTFGGAEFQENGDTGFRMRTAELVQNLLKWHEQLTEELNSPELLGEIVYVISSMEGTQCGGQCPRGC